MAEQWMSVAQAAAELKVHPRTIERRIAAGKINSRKNPDGQLQVAIELPDSSAAQASYSQASSAPPVEAEQMVQTPVSGAFETVKELADRQVDIAAGSASALIRVAQDQTRRVETELMLARQDAGRDRRDARLAMSFVAIMLIAVVGAVGWCTHTLTVSDSIARQSSQAAALATSEAQAQAERARQAEHAADQANIARAKAEGELAAYRTELPGVVALTHHRPAMPATRPATLLDRLATLWTAGE